MAKTVIQVPVDEELLKKLDNMSKKKKKARAEVIRQACQKYLKDDETKELDRIYQDGYRRVPETTETGESQLAMLKDILPDEEW
jgi:metal-responsive CopG/Arc/MetJ family transcriptional regulator